MSWRPRLLLFAAGAMAVALTLVRRRRLQWLSQISRAAVHSSLSSEEQRVAPSAAEAPPAPGIATTAQQPQSAACAERANACDERAKPLFAAAGSHPSMPVEDLPLDAPFLAALALPADCPLAPAATADAGRGYVARHAIAEGTVVLRAAVVASAPCWPCDPSELCERIMNAAIEGDAKELLRVLRASGITSLRDAAASEAGGRGGGSRCGRAYRLR